MKPLSHLKVGTKVKAGQLLGYTDLSGNQTGPHLHLETWLNAEDWKSNYDPMIEFEAAGIDPGDKPKGTTSGTVAKPAGKPTDFKDLRVDGNFGPLTVKAVQIIMTAVGTYNRAIDGSDGKYTWMAIQEWLAQRKYLDTKKWLIDGKPGPATIKALQKLLADRNFLDTKKWLIDGKFGKETVKAFQRLLNSQNGS